MAAGVVHRGPAGPVLLPCPGPLLLVPVDGHAADRVQLDDAMDVQA